MGAPASIWWWIGAGTLAVLAVSLLFVGWRGDRSRGRRRCPRCWYDMAGVGGRRCPECGREARAERRLFRTRRRRWALFFGGVFLAGSLGLGATPRVLRDGWAQYAPTTVLIWMLPTFDDESAQAYVEFQSRFDPWRVSRYDRSARPPTDALWGWQRSLLGSRCVRALEAGAPGVATEAALDVLAQLGPAGAAAVPRLCEMLDAPPRFGTARICQALGSIGPASLPALPRLRELAGAYSDDWEDSYNAQSALDAVAAIGVEAGAALPEVRAILDLPTPRRYSDDPRPAALRAAAALGPTAAVLMPRILELAAEAPYFVRVSALEAVGSIAPGDAGARPVVLACLESPEVGLRDKAAGVAQGDAGLLDAAIAQAREWLGEASTRDAGLRCCISLGSSAEPLRAVLIELARSEDAVTRWLCVAALVPQAVDPGVSRALRELAGDEDLRVRAAAAAGLRLGGRS